MFRTQCVLALVALFLGLAQSWDFAVTAGDRLELYTNRTKTATMSFDSQNLAAIAYDEVHNMLLYVDKQSNNDALCGYNISSVEYKCYIERNGSNIQGLAFDPITEMLFFTDTKERSINWISFKSGSLNSVYGNLLIKMTDAIPTDLAVDSCNGYIYWINSNIMTSTIERARFNGSQREVVINALFNWDLRSLVIDQQTQEIYWIMPETSLSHHIYSADLSGKNKKRIDTYTIPLGEKTFVTQPNTLTISKEYLYMVGSCSSCGPRSFVWKYSKPTMKTYENNGFLKVDTKSPVGISAKYKISEQIQGVQACKSLISLTDRDDSIKMARDYVEPFCDQGIKVNGQSLCKCSPGYTGKQCDVSVCENYCLQGDCSFNEEGLPKCRCNVGYSGKRCEVNVCHGYCSNNGTCFLNMENEPVCQCIDDYVGDRCEVSDCLNYCLQGDCSYNEEGLPKCRCNAGYSGKRCEVNVCHRYCLNNGTCFLNMENEPVCQCIDGYVGDRCEVSDCINYCLQGDCSYNEEGLPKCRCNAGYSGERCEVNVCHGYCANNGTCSLNNENEPVCHCLNNYAGYRCDVPVSLNNDNCSLNEEGSRCKADKNNTLSSSPTYYTAERNITLADLLANWRKPVTTISVVVEVK